MLRAGGNGGGVQRAGSRGRAEARRAALRLAAALALALAADAAPGAKGSGEAVEEDAPYGPAPAEAPLSEPPSGEAAHSEAPPEEPDWLFEEAPEVLPAERDPIEPVNREVFAGNELLYRFVLDPVAKGYSYVVPDPAERAVRRFFGNLGEPVVAVNDLLQLEPRRAGRTGARFVVNSTVGVVGLFDPAEGWGLAGHRNGFGDTLASYGVEGGPYLVIPVLGPSTARDLVGEVVDAALRPDTWLLSVGPRLALSTGSGLATYDLERERLDALRATSADFYAALRSAYLLERAARVREVREE